MIKLLISNNWKRENYYSMLIIIDYFIKMVYYKLVKISINASELDEVIIYIVI